MHDRIGHGTSSGGARYFPRRAANTAARVLAVVLSLVCAWPAAAAGNAIKPNGKWRRLEIKASGAHQAYLFKALAGVRYRVTAEGRSLERPIVELFFGRADAPAETARAEVGTPAVIDWRAERNTTAEIRVRGFSLATGKARVKLETVDATGKPTRKAERWLAVGDGTPYSVSDLLLGEQDEWHLAVSPGQAYSIESSIGGVARVRLRVLTKAGEPLADSNQWWQPHGSSSQLRFRVPEPGESGATPSLRLHVEAVWPSAGDYGVMLKALEPDASCEPPEQLIEADAEAAPVEGRPLTFTLGEGDMAVLWIPEGHPLPQRAVFMQLRNTWVQVESQRSTDRDLGHIARGRRPGHGNFQSFRPYQPGTYRFSALPGRAANPEVLKLYSREALGPPPVHMGTHADPTAKARTSRSWKPIGLGICVPGITYLFVSVDAPTSIGMRVRTLDGQTLASRSAGGASAPGFGPSLRFRVKVPSVVRLEARGGRGVVAALLRELRQDG